MMEVHFKDGQRCGADAIFLHLAGQKHWAFLAENGTIFDVQGHVYEWDRCVKEAPKGMIMEFGVRAGNTIREIAKYADIIYGFDWWKGLPHDWDDYSPKGSCLTAKPTDLPGNVVLVEGLFSDTLEGFLGEHDGPVGFVNLDCDLYASSLYVLHCLVDRFVKGSMVAFSAMTHFPTLAQKKAFDRYLAETGQRWEFVGRQHHWGEVYRCVDTNRR